MLHLNRQSLKENRAEWEKAGITLYSYDDEAVRQLPSRLRSGSILAAVIFSVPLLQPFNSIC